MVPNETKVISKSRDPLYLVGVPFLKGVPFCRVPSCRLPSCRVPNCRVPNCRVPFCRVPVCWGAFL